MISLRRDRKQLLILGLSGMLAITAYWIPAPQESSTSSFSGLADPASHSATAETEMEPESILIYGHWPYPLEKHSALI